MLSRQASSLYWIGRYQERAEYMSRFLQVKYLSTMDSTMADYSSFALRSIIFMCQGKSPSEIISDHGEILYDVALNVESETSIISYATAVRENTKGIRNLISNEMWEVVNKNYHFVNNFNAQYLKTRGLYEFTKVFLENSSAFQAKLDSTLLHDDVWAFLKLGIYVERAYQINRILINTLIDINALQGEKRNLVLENHQWLTTLDVLEASDMTRKIFKTYVQQDNASEFLITNLDFPRSIAFSIGEINKLIKKIKNSSELNQLDRDSLVFKSSKLSASIKYIDFKDIQDELPEFLNNTLKEIFLLNDSITKEFF